MDCWHHEIDKATSEAEVVRSAGDYLVLWAPREIAPTTLGLSALRIENCDDIERVKSHLADSPAAATAATPQQAHLRELADYFWHAASRIGELRRSRAQAATPIPYLR
jgi:hypothetical protein